MCNCLKILVKTTGIHLIESCWVLPKYRSCVQMHWSLKRFKGTGCLTLLNVCWYSMSFPKLQQPLVSGWASTTPLHTIVLHPHTLDRERCTLNYCKRFWWQLAYRNTRKTSQWCSQSRYVPIASSVIRSHTQNMVSYYTWLFGCVQAQYDSLQCNNLYNFFFQIKVGKPKIK